jgi:polysaccharide deacetylase family protein (PEP-CTERM system associated)
MNILTFDVEEWFHILDNESTKTEQQWSNFEYRLESNMDRILELLERKNQKATFFCLGWVAREFPNILKKIDDMGFEIGSHSDRHQLVYEQSKSDFTSDLGDSIKSIEDVIGKKVKMYRAPGFSIRERDGWVFEELLRHGIEVDSSIFPAKRSHGGFESFGSAEPSLIKGNGFAIKEFPINLHNMFNKNFVFSGGGYFRLIPYYGLKHMMKESDYVMTYFHPRDFDSEQPVISELSLLRRFKSYYGLKSAFNKLEMLLDDFEFMDLNQAVSEVKWDQVKIIDLANHS